MRRRHSIIRYIHLASIRHILIIVMMLPFFFACDEQDTGRRIDQDDMSGLIADQDQSPTITDMLSFMSDLSTEEDMAVVSDDDLGLEMDMASEDDFDISMDAEVMTDPSYCFQDTLSVNIEGEGWTSEGEHYRVYTELSEARTEELGRLLEASWEAFQVYFNYSPPLDDGQKLWVNVYQNRDRWQAGMASDGISHQGDAGGYFDPNTRKAYLYQQPTLYYTDSLILHEATHQFHLLGRLGQNQLPWWYVEGVAEYLAHHDWDGACVRLGVLPLLTREDYPANALNDYEAMLPDLNGILQGDFEPSRPMVWALYSYLQSMSNLFREGFTTLRETLDQGEQVDSFSLFSELIAEPSTLQIPILEWLEQSQLPFIDIYLEWTSIGPKTIRGHGLYFSYALLKESYNQLSYTAIPNQDDWAFGVIIDHEDSENYTGVVLFHYGEVSTFEMEGGSAVWYTQEVLDIPINEESITVRVIHEDGETSIWFGEYHFTFNTRFPLALGLVTQDSDILFDDLSWSL
jgi:hypothetical protein